MDVTLKIAQNGHDVHNYENGYDIHNYQKLSRLTLVTNNGHHTRIQSNLNTTPTM